MAKLPFTAYGFTLRPVPEMIGALEQASFAAEHRRLATSPIPHHLLVATKTKK